MARKYEMKRRARDREQTHRRIIEAAVQLHQDVGPVQTTISAIAERAGLLGALGHGLDFWTWRS